MELEKGLKGEKILYAIIDINGANSVHNLKIPANFIGILPPSEEILEKRLRIFLLNLCLKRLQME